MTVEEAGPLDQLRRSFAAVAELVDRVGPDQWSAATPCAGWPVRRLVQHLAGLNRVFVAVLAGEPVPRREEVPDAVLPAAFRRSADELLEAFGRPGALDREHVGPLGTTTGEDRLRIRLYDLLAHGWDLAQATGQPGRLPEDAAEESLAFARRQLREEDRPGRFAPATTVADDAPALLRLVAFLGRDVEPDGHEPRTPTHAERPGR